MLPALADGGEDYLFGDWSGKRSELQDSGIAIESILTYDVVSNLSGGIDRSTAGIGNYDLTFTFDAEKLVGIKGGTLFAYVLGNFGGSPSSFIGDLQVSDNIETFSTAKLYEFWYEQSLFDDKASIRVGLHDYNSEFDALDFAGGLFNSSFGISYDISQVGPSIFATTSLAARLKIQPAENCYIQGAVYDGVPGDPDHQAGTQIKLRDEDGLFYALETGYSRGEGVDHRKIALGLWQQTTDFEDFSGTTRSNNGGVYFIGESVVYQESDDGAQGLGVFFQSGLARGDRNQVDLYLGGGFAYTGLFPGLEEDTTSFGFAFARNSDDFRDTDRSEFESGETAIELNHRFSIRSYFALTPDLQYIVNPGTSRSLDNALVATVRAEIAM